MSRFCGKIGFSETKETKPGVHTQVGITEQVYFGDVNRNVWKVNSGSKVNDDLTINTEISIVADSFARENFHRMTYVQWKGILWEISSVDDQYPRLILSIGDVYNGPTATDFTS